MVFPRRCQFSRLGSDVAAFANLRNDAHSSTRSSNDHTDLTTTPSPSVPGRHAKSRREAAWSVAVQAIQPVDLIIISSWHEVSVWCQVHNRRRSLLKMKSVQVSSGLCFCRLYIFSNKRRILCWGKIVDPYRSTADEFWTQPTLPKKTQSTIEIVEAKFHLCIVLQIQANCFLGS